MRDEDTRNQKGMARATSVILGDRALRIPWMIMAALHARSSLSKRAE